MRIRRDARSTVNLRAIVRMAMDTVRIAWRLRAQQSSALAPPIEDALFELATID